MTSPRFIFLFMAATCAVLMGVGLYLEHVVGLEPCPLCVMQRIFFILVGVVALIAGIQAPGKRGRRIYGVVLLLLAAAGAATAGRQVYLQTVPAEELAACLPSLDYMMQALPFQEIIRLVLHGTADSVVDVSAAEHAAALLPNATTSYWEGTDHGPFVEDPQRFAAEVTRFAAAL